EHEAVYDDRIEHRFASCNHAQMSA
ncbi:MAG: hypothetical protein ACJAUC_003855, partial [Planctomycetota bacterium]